MNLQRTHRFGLFAAVCGLAFVASAQPVAAADLSEPEELPVYSDAEYQALITEIDTKLGHEPDAAESPEERETGWDSLHSRVEAGLIQILESFGSLLPAPPEQIAEDFRAGDLNPRVWLAMGELLGAVLIAMFTLRVLRGRGDVSVSIHYPAELRGAFIVRISKRRFRNTRRQAETALDPGRARQYASAATRFEHTMVARETRFRELFARRYNVMVYGYLQPLDSEKVVATHLEERSVRVRRGRTERLDFDFHPTECVLDVTVIWEGRPVANALVALRGDPDSLRYTRGEPARLALGTGNHTLVVGSRGRVAERQLKITSFEPVSIEVDVGNSDNTLFSGCPPAVVTYLHGDVPAAARQLERDGQQVVAHLILARLHHERGQIQKAAEHYEACGQLLEAAELEQQLNHFERSAELFDRAAEPGRAGEMWRQAGELSRAGDAYERANRWEEAIDCYREDRDISRWASALERQGKPLEAAHVAFDHADWAQAIRTLQQIGTSDPNYVSATHLLIDSYQRAGQLDLALHKTEELVSSEGIERVSLDSCDRLARLLEDNGEFERSLDVLEALRQRDATYPNVATRIEQLRKRVYEEADTNATSGSGDAFGSESRYEILAELGRGGMGVVFRARDRRLGRVIALKRLPENLRNHPKAVQLFLREARSAAALNHPNIVTVYDAGQECGVLYITMELLEGMPLQQILKSRGQLTARDTARLGLQIAKGLQYAHEQRIIHRDIKTGNLFFTNSKKVKIMDFGLAKMVREYCRESTIIGGTPYYMAPEQSLGEAIDHRADLYSLGVTLYELSTGRVPFTEGDVAYHHRHTAPTDPRERVASIPAELADLILQLLAKSPDERCASGQEVVERLHRLSKG